MADLKTNFTNRAESTLSSALAAGATTINVTDTTAFPAVPFRAVIDPGSDANAEEVLVDAGKTATTFTLTSATSRGQSGTTDVAHDSGAVIAIVPTAGWFIDIHDRIDNAGSVDSVNGETGTVVLDAADVGADPAGTAASAVGTHEADATDAHDASAVSFDATGLINTSATEMQTAISDLDGAIGSSTSALDDLSDVDTTGAADGDALTYQSGQWVPVESGGGAHVEAKSTAGSASTESVTWTAAFAATPVVTASVVRSTLSSTSTPYVAQVSSRSTTGASIISALGSGGTSGEPKDVIATEAT